MKFLKMNGIGNDFILIDYRGREGLYSEEALSGMARHLCDRHLSIGADGLILIEKARGEGDFRMRFFNADGSIGEMCGNGARCVCRYGYERGISGKRQHVETMSGLITGERINRREYRILMNPPSMIQLRKKIEVSSGKRICGYVEFGMPGLPHAVVRVPGLSKMQVEEQEALRALGREIRHGKEFPKGANVNFYDMEEDGAFYLKTFERGVEDFTYACGSGSAATAVILKLSGMVKKEEMLFRMRGGQLAVRVVSEKSGTGQGAFGVREVWLSGLTNMVAFGELTDEEFLKKA